MAESRKVQLEAELTTTGVKQGAQEVKTTVADMANAVSQEAGRAGRAVDQIGDGGQQSSQKIERSTRSMIQSIQRTTAAMEAGSRSSAQYYETLAKQRGVDVSALRPYLDQLDEVQAKQRLATGALAAGGAELNKYGMSARATAAAMRGVPAQMTDIFVSLQGGQRPMTVLLQQGGQLKDMFGGIVPAARALGTAVLGMVNPFTLAAAAVGGLYLAYRSGASEAEEFNRTIIMTGNAVGMNADQMQDMAARISGVVGTQRQASAALNEFAQSSLAGSANLEKFVETAVRWEQATGQAVSETIKQFEELGKSPVEAALKLNESMNFLTVEVYDTIKALEDQGRATDAAEVVYRQFADTLNDRAPQLVQQTGGLERAWIAVRNAVAGALSAIAGVGRASTMEDQLRDQSVTVASLIAQVQQLEDRGRTVPDRLRQQLAASQGLLEDLRQGYVNAATAATTVVEEQNRLNDALTRDSYLSETRRMSRQQQMQKDLSEERAAYEKAVAAAKGNAKDLERIETAHQEALRNIKKQYEEKQTKPKKTEAQRELERQQKEELRMLEAFEKERTKYITSQNDEILAIEQKTLRIQDEIAVYGLGKGAIEAMTIARLEEKAAMLAGWDGSEDEVARIKAEIAARKELMAVTSQKEAMDANKKAAEDAAREWQRSTDQIGQSLTDALMRGFEDGKSFAGNFRDVVVNMFRTLVLRPIIEPVMKGVAGSAVSMLGMGNAQAGQSGGIGDMFGGSNWFGNFGGNVGELAQDVGHSLWKAGFEDIGSTLADNAFKIGEVANIAGDVLGYGKAIFDVTQGNWGSGIGTAIGQWAGGPIGAAIGSMLGGMLDEAFKGETRYGGSFALERGGSTYYEGGPSGGVDRAAAQFADSLLQTASQSIQRAFTAVGSDAIVDRMMVGFETSEKGRGGTQSAGSLFLGGEVIHFGEVGKGTGHGGRDGTIEEMMANAEIETWQTIIEAWQAGIDEFPSVMRDMIRNVDADALGLEAAQTLAQQFVALAEQLNALSTALDSLPFVPAIAATFEYAAALAEASGGAEAVAANLATFWQNFYTDAERMAALSDQLSSQFADLGVAMPETRQGFRELVEAQLALGDAGAETVAVLLGMSGSFAELATSLEQAEEAALRAAEAERQAAEQLAARIASERSGLEGQLLSLLGDTAEIRRRELDALDPSNRALQERIWALEEEATAAQAAAQRQNEIMSERLGLETTLLQLQGNTAELRRRELEQLDPSNRAIQLHIWALQDEQAAAQEAAAAIAKAAQQNREAANTALGALSDAINARKGELQSAFDLVADGFRNAIDRTQDSLSDLQSLAGRLQSTLSSMRGQTDGMASRQWAQQQLAQSLSVARLTGVMPTGANFEDALSVLAQPSEDLFATFEDYQADFASTASDIFALNELTAQQISIEERTLRTLQNQLEYAEKSHAEELARYDEMLENARMQVELALGTYTQTKSIAQAMYDVYRLVAAINAKVGAEESLPGFAIGTNYVPQDMNVRVHQGEAIVPKAYNPAVNPGLYANQSTEETRALRHELGVANERIGQLMYTTAKTNQQMLKLMERWDGDGIPEERVVTA